MREGDVAEMRRLLTEHPEMLRTKEGHDYWLKSAARNGLLPVVEMLVDLGIDVNECDVVGLAPIEVASSKGQLEVVKWLLDHSANAKLPEAVLSATRGGHFEIVKLLVERGADIHESWHDVNALKEPEDYGHTEIAEYLRSKGAKDL